MHILLIHQAFVALDEPGGTRHHELARCLAARGHQVTVIASTVSYLTGKAEAAGNLKEEVDGGSVTVLRARTYSALHRSFVHRVFSFFSFMASSFWLGLKVRQVDLVWGTSPPIFQGVTAWCMARLKRVPFLFEVRDLWPAFAIQVGVLRNPILIRLSRWLERFLYRRADRVMVNSPGFIKYVQRRGGRRVELVPNGVDTAMFDPYENGIAFRQDHGLEGRFVVLYAGAHGLSNDLNIVLQAAQRLMEQPKVGIVLLGDGKEKATLMAKADELGLTNLHFLPPVPKTGMAEALAAADACLAILKPIRLYATVYPNKVFDYMAAGRPVILAIDGVIRRVVEQADGGIFTPPGDPDALAQAILRLMEDPQRARQMGLNARAYVEANFDRAALALHLAEIIEQMGKNRRRA
jgi:glycosyltransferase involved in cell wall biosynthesis